MRYFHFSREHGTTLIELLVSLTIGAIIAAAMASLFAQSVTSREQVNRTSQRLENGRYGLDAIAEDVRLAGFFGDYSPPSTTTWSTGDPCVASLTALKTQWSPTGPILPVPIIGYEGHGATYTDPTCLTNKKSGTDVVAIRRLSTTTLLPSAVVTGVGAVMQVSTQPTFCTTADTASFAIADSSADLTLHRSNPTDCATLAYARVLVARLYYIATCNICSGSSADTTPTLKMAELINGAFVVRSIAPGIDDLHLEYGVDSSAADGSADEYRLSSNDGLADTKNWSDVVSIRIYLLARDLQTAPDYINNDVYTLGSKSLSAFGDAVKRNVLSTTARLTNVSGRRELP